MGNSDLFCDDAQRAQDADGFCKLTKSVSRNAVRRRRMGVATMLAPLALFSLLILGAGVAEAQSGPPTVVQRVPAPGAIGQFVNVHVSATFSEAIQSSSVSFTLVDSSNQAIPSSVSYDPSSHTVTLTPGTDLTPSRTYTATVSGAKDLAGNAMAGPSVWSFSTGQPGFQESAVLQGLVNPTAFDFASDGRIFVAQKSGVILVYQGLNDSSPTVFADLRTNVHNFGNRGLLGMALAPNFPSTPYVYVFYAYDSPIGGTAPTWGSAGASNDPCSQPGGACVVSGRISRLQANGNIMTGTEQVLVEDWYQQYATQSVGNLAFGPDGALYAAAGDGASSTMVDVGQTDPASPDPPQQGGALRSQDLITAGDPITLDGSVIRIDPNSGQPLRQSSSMQVSDPTIDGNNVKSYSVTSVYQGSEPLTVRVLEPTNPAPGKPHRLLYILPVDTGVSDLSSQYSDGLEELRLLDVQDRFNLTLIAPSFNYVPWYGDNVLDSSERMESFIVNDLVPWGDTFIQGSGIPQRFLIGFSKSGNGVLSLILRHPDVFSEAAAWDGPVENNDLSAFGGLDDNFGTQANYNLYNIPSLVTSNGAAFTRQNRLWISGDQVVFTDQMQQLHDQLTAAGIPHTWVAGGVREHSWSSGWLDGAVTALDANSTTTAPVNANAQSIVAFGLRNPRLAFRPGTPEIWISDRGWNTAEEIDQIPDGRSQESENFGWPCYEGASQTAYSGAGICTTVYAHNSTALPFYSYSHQQKVTAGDEDGVGSGSISGLAFYGTGNYPNSYHGSLFFADSVRNQIWVMFAGDSGLPDPNNIGNFLLGASSPVDLKTGPNGDLFYADFNGGTIRRISYTNPVVLSGGQPSGVLAAGTQQTMMSLATDQNATCRYATTPGVAFGAMPNVFSITGGTLHSSLITNLAGGTNYDFYVRCEDAQGNVNPDDFRISFSVALAGDSTPPVRTSGAPSGLLPAGTTQATLSLVTNENATCRYATDADTAYEAMTNVFGGTGGLAHNTVVTGLADGNDYSYYVRCQDTSGNENPDDYAIVFSVDTAGGEGGGSGATATSGFAGSEAPLSENGMWDRPGSWASLRKNNGAYSTGVNAGARLATPVVGADQYAEITYDQDPGTGSWVGVMTRVQGPTNGSGYLAIAYAGEVRLYEADDSGGLNFWLLDSASVNVGSAPRDLRIESQGATQRVYFNGVLEIEYTSDVYTGGEPGIAASTFGGPAVHILTFSGGDLGSSGAGDTTPPVRASGTPTGVLAAGTTQTTLSLVTNENATCRYATVAGTAYEAMTNLFANTGGMAQSTVVTGLADGIGYSYYVRCQDSSGNENPDDYAIVFSVAMAGSGGGGSGTAATSGFAGSEAPLSESGMWDRPGSWASLSKNNGAYSTGVNAGARLVTPSLNADQYAEITYDQDPGTGSWVGVMTRVQGPTNGSGYLAIAYAGEVRLYEADDAGGLGFPLLASANVNVGTAPRDLRIESQGATQRVYFNGVLEIEYTSGVYTGGEPGIAASTFGGPAVHILTFSGGDLASN